MAEVYFWAAAGSFALFGYGMARRLGLLDDVPRDPQARVASFTSAVLVVVKDQLIGSQLVTCETERIHYVKDGRSGTLWFEDSAVHCLHGDERASFQIGDLGNLSFDLEGDEISIKIFAAETGGAERTAQVSVRMLPKSAGS